MRKIPYNFIWLFFSPISPSTLLFFLPLSVLLKTLSPLLALQETQHVHGAGRDRSTRGKHSMTAEMSPCHLRQCLDTGGLRWDGARSAMLKPKVQGHEVCKTVYDWWNSEDCDRPNSRSICLFEGWFKLLHKRRKTKSKDVNTTEPEWICSRGPICLLLRTVNRMTSLGPLQIQYCPSELWQIGT